LVDLRAATPAGEAPDLTFAAVKAQTVTLHNTGARGLSVTVNGTAVSIGAGGLAKVLLERREVPGNPGFAPDFADEPPVEGEIDSQTAY
jgi:hypothetical protein